MRVGVDVDDVLFPWTEYAHEAALEAGITNGGTPTRWGFHEDYGITADELWSVLFEAYNDGMLLRPFYPDAASQLARLREAGHSIHIVTARGFEAHVDHGFLGKMVRIWTEISLDREGIPHDSLTFVKDKTFANVDVFIDDSLGNCRALQAAGIDAYLRDQPHNQSGPWTRRVDNLEHFVDLLCDRNDQLVAA